MKWHEIAETLENRDHVICRELVDLCTPADIQWATLKRFICVASL